MESAGRSVKLEHTLAESIEVRHHSRQQEEHDADQPGECLLGLWLEIREGCSPWIQKDDLNIEDEEDHRDQVKADIESLAGGLNRRHAALVRDAFGFALAPRAEDQGADHVDACEADGTHDHQEDGQIRAGVTRAQGCCDTSVHRPA